MLESGKNLQGEVKRSIRKKVSVDQVVKKQMRKDVPGRRRAEEASALFIVGMRPGPRTVVPVLEELAMSLGLEDGRGPGW